MDGIEKCLWALETVPLRISNDLKVCPDVAYLVSLNHYGPQTLREGA